jgi:hypothetical protein
MDVYAYQKQSWSKPIDEDNTLYHLGIGGKILCGIDKRHFDIYNPGFDQLDISAIDSQEIHFCKLCFKIYKKQKQIKKDKMDNTELIAELSEKYELEDCHVDYLSEFAEYLQKVNLIFNQLAILKATLVKVIECFII